MCPAFRDCDGECCEEGFVCGMGSCCLADELCGGACCGADSVCVADRCELRCGERAVCGAGADAVCCDTGDVCYLGACRTPGDACTRSLDCPDGEYCEASIGACLPRSSGEACEYRPEVEDFSFGEEWNWDGDAEVMPAHNQIMMAPVVANLSDDNDDGRIDENDVPEVIFSTFAGSQYWEDGILRAVRGNDGSRLWPTATPDYRVTPGGSLAIADVDPASPGPEVIACGESDRTARTPGHLLIIAADGSLLRRFDTAPNVVPCGFSAPAVGDMDGDGVPEIAVGLTIAHGDGTVVRTIRDRAGAFTAFANVDGDEDLELVAPEGAYNMDGTPVWERRALEGDSRPAVSANYLAIADLDLDGDPEVVVVSGGSHSIQALDGATGDTIWGPTNINPDDPSVNGRIAAQMAASPGRNAATGGGPPTIANFDDDPEPEIAFAGGYAYVIFEPDGTLKWFHESQDISSRATGSSIFDFEGDGVAEVLYNDERNFKVFRGTDGTVFSERCNTSGTLFEFPLVVDVDNDDHAEIVLMENNYAFRSCGDGSPSTTGLHVFGHPTNQWVRTRRIWNQHAYSVTNINEDGTVPARRQTNWSTERLNNFRQNVQPDGLFDAPDLVPVDLITATRSCPTSLEVAVRVVNEGRATAPAGVPVSFYVDGMRFDGGVTSRPLLAGESELLSVIFPIPMGQESNTFEFTVRVNAADEEPLPELNECRPENNEIGPIEGRCPTLG